MKWKIDTILPILIALVLPGISIINNAGTAGLGDLNLLASWAFIGVILYLLWHLLWWFNLPQKGQREWLIIAGLTLAIVALWSTSFFLSDEPPTKKYFFIIRIALAGVLIWVVQYALKAQRNIAQLQLEKEQMQKENYRVQLLALQAKIDPHFLYNSLNTLRSMVRQGHENAEAFVISLSDFYRQTLQYREDTTLPLKEELAVLESYLFLMKSRNERAVDFKLNVPEALHTRQIPAFALQIVIENCFKHNSMSTKKPLQIEIATNENAGYLEVSNNLQPKIGAVPSSGQGLDLLHQRYALLNVERGIIIQKSTEEFNVKLKLLPA